MGGVITPGIMISAEALYSRAAKLPRIEITKPSSVVGKNTVSDAIWYSLWLCWTGGRYC